jgi:netrin-G3 ligand
LAWPDHGVPNNAISMVNFIKRVRKTHPYSKQDLLLVHCSAGVGRTGTFITLDSMLERIKTENSINIFEFVSNLRKQRVLMVQTSVSFVYEWKCNRDTQQYSMFLIPALPASIFSESANQIYCYSPFLK